MNKRQEWLPVAIGLVGPRGTDVVFVTFIQETMENTKVLETMDAGRDATSIQGQPCCLCFSLEGKAKHRSSNSYNYI
jgi:hypothetical protein